MFLKHLINSKGIVYMPEELLPIFIFETLQQY